VILLRVITLPGTAAPPDVSVCRGESVEVWWAACDKLPEPTRTELVVHWRVIQEAAAHAPVLPVRFGTAVASLDELRGVVAAREEAWSARLSQLRGDVEVIVHLRLPPAASSTAVASGADYLQQRVREAHTKDALRADLCGLLDHLVNEQQPLPARGGERLALRLPADAVGGVREAITSWADARSDVDGVSITGPWPPFSFAGEVVA
jgi:hypothetical protein